MESELVSGFMTEHAASIFVFFFLAEYASILLMSILTCILFLGGYTCPITPFIVLNSVLNTILPWFLWVLVNWYSFIDMIIISISSFFDFGYESVKIEEFAFNLKLADKWIEKMASPIYAGTIAGFTLGFKTCLIVFTFIWVRASFPRIRYDQLMTFCWTVLLPILFAFIILIPCVLYSFDAIPVNFSLLILPGLYSKPLK